MPVTGTTLVEALDSLRQSLIEWYHANHRDFPWRETTDAYAILVSEVMSQQTQLDRVIDPWEAFLGRWPTIEDLAAADRADVVGFWSEHRLGYNRRARYLHETAQELVSDFEGNVPKEIDALQTLPGIGPYTANAVASFAFNDGEAVVDTNVKRVLYRAFDIADESTAFEEAANTLLPEGESRIWNNAIMELGATVCVQTPHCDDASCPWRSRCHAYETGDFTAPDVPTQAAFEGSRRQFRGRVVRALRSGDGLTLDQLGPKIRVDYHPEGEFGRAWLRGIVEDLEGDGLVTLEDQGDETVASLRR